MTAALAGLIACGVSCAKKNESPTKSTLPPPAEPLPTNAPAAPTNSAAAPAPVVVDNTTVTNVPPATEITNPPPAETTLKAPEPVTTPETNVPGHNTVVEMPTNPPAAPTNFYAPSFVSAQGGAKSSGPVLTPIGQTSEGCTNFFFRFRAGYEHVYHGDNNDSYWLSAKFYAFGDGLRQQAPGNAWLIPDADAEVSSGYVAKPDGDRHPGAGQGLQFRAAFTWPWIHWTELMFTRTNSICPFCRPLALGLGPTVNLGFDHLYDETDYRFARYAGVRLTFNRTGYVEYTVGETEGLDSTRQQVVAEIPFYESRDGEVRYYLRGLWNHGLSSKPDILEGGLFVEMPFSTLVQPDKWGDLVPFAQ